MNNKQVFNKVFTFYKQVQHGKMNISSAISKIQATLALAGANGNDDAQTALDTWDNQVLIYPKIHFINKIKHDLPTLYNDEYNFENNELGINKSESKANANHVVNQDKQELKRVQKMPNVLLQYNGYTGHVEIAQATGLTTLIHNLKTNIKNESKVN